jgi:biopolymer transport protein ExbB
MNLTKLFISGGVVMYPLLAASILVVTLAIERLHFWSKIGNRQQQLMRTVLNLYQNQSPLVIDKLEREQDFQLREFSWPRSLFKMPLLKNLDSHWKG